MRISVGFLSFLLFLYSGLVWADEVDDVIRSEMERQHIPGMSIAVVQGGKIIREAGYGLANVELGVPATPETIYQSGSIGKQFTAALVMLLVEDGKIALDDPISKYLPNIPDSWQKVTVRHLLTHTSGMGDPFDKLDLRKDYSEDELLKIEESIPLRFAPGEKWEYSNTGYQVLGFLCSKVGGKFYGEQLRERIFQPAGMTTARIISERDIVPNRAAGYELIKGELKNQSWVSPMLNTTADGSLYLTVRDMAKWDAALYGDKLLSRGSRDALWTPVKLNNGTTHPYGFGWFLSPVGGRRCVSHNGLWQGFATNIDRYVDDKLTVIVLTNLAGADPKKIGRRIAAHYVPTLAPSTSKPSVTETPFPKYQVKSSGIVVMLDAQGGIAGCRIGKKNLEWPLVGGTRLGGCRTEGEVKAEDLAEGVYQFTRKLVDNQGHACTLVERFLPTKDSVRWELEIASDNEPWSTAISTRLKNEATPEMRFWTAWSDPEHQSSGWHDPMVAMPFSRTQWPYSNLTEPAPVRGDFISVPLATTMQADADVGMSIVFSPEDHLLNAWLATDKDGTVRFTRQNHRLGKGKRLRFAMDLVSHEADWRGGMRWMVSRYPNYFDPPNSKAAAMAGCGAYSGDENPIDVAKFKKMAFRINWKLSDDFAYMGMFIPPVKDADETWLRSCDEPPPPGKGRNISCRQMNDYARHMKDNGFHVLNYFNVTEFGKQMSGRPVSAEKTNDPELWKDPYAFLKLRMPHAALVPHIPTFYGAIVVDPGDPTFQQFILEQAERHNRWLPDAAGICIDRMDWLLLYNEHADDGVSWVDGNPARAGSEAWKSLMAKLGPLMHRAEKVVFGNPMAMRLDLMRDLDGFYSEHCESGPGLNSIAWVSLRKPALTWTCMWWDKPVYELKPDPDRFFQRHLLMGVYPTAPYPFNHHALQPHPETDRHYLDYGPLLDAMRGKKWVLEPHCIETAERDVKANLFQVPGGYVVPVTFGGKAEAATIRIRNVHGLDKVRCEALHPGVDSLQPAASTFKDGTLEIKVPLHRGCAMVKIFRE